MSLICELGWHKGDRLAPWNNGYYFSKCRRCRRDIVKGSTGGWFAPKGFRVVWQGTAPEHRRHGVLAEERHPHDVGALPPAAAAVTAAAATAAAAAKSEPPAPPPLPEEAMPEAPEAVPADMEPPAIPAATAEAVATAPAPVQAAAMRNELPIQEVLRQLEQDAPSTAHTVTEAPVPAPAAAPPRQPAAAAGDDFDFDDFFLEDERDEKSWQLAVEPSPAGPAGDQAPASAAPAMSAPAAEGAAEPSREGAPPAPDARPKRSYEVPAVVGGTLFLAALTAGLLAHLFTPSGDRPADVTGNTIGNVAAEAQPDEEAFASPIDAAGTTKPADITPSVEPAQREPAVPDGRTAEVPAPVASAVVTASIVNCRSNASEAAPTIRKMVRGARVDVLASQAGWVNVSYRGKQCWVADEYLDVK